MEVEFVISGICNFINMDNDDDSIVGPSVVLIKADKTTFHGHHGDHGSGEHGGNGEHGGTGTGPKPDFDHIPYLAYDSRLVTLADDTGFRPVRNAPAFKFLKIDDMEIRLDFHGAGVPILDSTFDNVIGNETFGLTSRHFKPEAAPPRGGRPSKSVVTSWMRFGGGKISGGRLCPFKWRVTKKNGDTFSRHFAEEVIYRFEETELSDVSVSLVDLEDAGSVRRRLVFRPAPNSTKVTLFVGNNIEADMDTAVRRQRPATDSVSEAGHFAFFNNILDLDPDDLPRMPEAVRPPGTGGTGGGGGPDGGICGPKQ